MERRAADQEGAGAAHCGASVAGLSSGQNQIHAFGLLRMLNVEAALPRRRLEASLRSWRQQRPTSRDRSAGELADGRRPTLPRAGGRRS